MPSDDPAAESDWPDQEHSPDPGKDPGKDPGRDPGRDPGNLRAVRGIGPKAENCLKKAGIEDLGQLARTPVNELAAALAGLHGKFDADRIVREQWIAQAAALAAAASASASASSGLNGEVAVTQQVRHIFTVEVRLPIADRDVVSTKVVHVQTGDEETWAGWRPERLVAFIEDRSRIRPGARLPQPGAGTAERAGGETPQPGAETAEQAGTAPAPQPAATPPDGPEPGRAPAPGPASRPVPAQAPSPAEPTPAGDGPGDGPGGREALLHTYTMVPAAGQGAVGGQMRAANATLTFDSAALNLLQQQTATVRAEVCARQLLTGNSVVVGERSAAVNPDERFRLDIACDLSAPSRPFILFALVRILVEHGEAQPAARDLAGASLLISADLPPRAAVPPATAALKVMA